MFSHQRAQLYQPYLDSEQKIEAAIPAVHISNPDYSNSQLCSHQCPSGFGKLRILPCPGSREGSGLAHPGWGCSWGPTGGVDVPTFGAIFGVKVSFLMFKKHHFLPVSLAGDPTATTQLLLSITSHPGALITPRLRAQISCHQRVLPLSVGFHCDFSRNCHVLLPQPCWALLC